MELLRKFHGRDDSDGGDDSSVLPSQSDQPRGSMTRKRRRGIIEKKRRDRINNCLSELKRLVPAAFEKQGSQKLEKAEILQMTVEHLHFIRSKGADTFLYDPQRFATDYHSMGFRDCATEVARYLTSVEGMDSQDPVRIRLMTHLQTYNIQRAGHSWTNGQWSAGAATNTLSWPATNSGGKFETSAAYGISPYTVGDSTYATNSGLSANQNYSSMHMITSSTNQIQGTSFRAPIAAASGPFQPVVGGSNGTTAAATAGGLNINLAFLTSANSGHTGANGSSIVGRNGWNPSDMSSY